MEAKDVSVIVPVYNGGENWVRCLDALAALEPAPLEVIVVDDGSTDDSRKQASRRGFTVLQSEKAQNGPGLARNLGASQARGSILFFVDADVVVSPDAVRRVAEELSDPKIGAIFGSYDDRPAANNFISQYKNLMHHFVHQNSSEEATTFWAGCGAVRKSTFDSVDGFAACYRKPSIEDIELGCRMHRAGYNIRLVKDLQAKHLKHWTFRSLLYTDITSRAVPWAGLILCDREMPPDLNLQTAHRLSTVFCFLLPFVSLGVFLTPLCLLLIGLLVVGLLAFNSDLYGFFLTRRGVGFTVKAIPLHWFYYIYSGATFGSVLLYMFWRYPNYMTREFVLSRFRRTVPLNREQAPEQSGQSHLGQMGLSLTTPTPDPASNGGGEM